MKRKPSACSKGTYHVILELTIQNEWKLEAIDIKIAFLQGEPIDRKLFVIPPPESNTPKVYNKCIYGLSDASLKWYSRVDNVVKFHKAIITKLRGTILIGKEDKLNLKEDKLNFKYLGLNVTSINSIITLNQYQYIQNLHKIDIDTD